jgi:hypothetical protein
VNTVRLAGARYSTIFLNQIKVLFVSFRAAEQSSHNKRTSRTLARSPSWLADNITVNHYCFGGNPRRSCSTVALSIVGLRRATSCLEHALALGALNFGAQLLALAHEALVPLEFADDAVLGNTGSEPLQQRIEGLATS